VDTEEAVTGLVGCLVLFIFFGFWFLVLWGLWELIHLIARS